MDSYFWQNKRVVITGSGGFVGKNLYKYLLKKAAKLRGIESRLDVDVSSYGSLKEVFQNPFDVCFHLAGDVLVEEGRVNPYSTIKNNIVSTLNVLELCRLHNVKRIIIASTAHVYGDGNQLFHEEQPPRPTRPYETSKTCIDLIAQSYADTYHLPVLIPRFVNIYGPGDTNFTRIIPKTIISILKGKEPQLWGGSSIREYLYIDDVISAFDLIARMTDYQIERNRIYNFGTGESITVQNLFNKLIALSGYKGKIKKIKIERQDEIKQQRVSWSKAKRVLDWSPQVRLDEGLRTTIDWYKKNLTKLDHT